MTTVFLQINKTKEVLSIIRESYRVFTDLGFPFEMYVNVNTLPVTSVSHSKAYPELSSPVLSGNTFV